ncbi:MAG: tRNA dihydrouridine synthase DusB [Phycisphaerales bacterium]|nr:tRNA dihydrouridine synthase DusB [Phycisphaerales bacterium]
MLKIGHFETDSNLLLAPISGYCDLAFRLVVRPLGGLGLASTDLINPRGLLNQTSKTRELVRTEPVDRPLCLQLYGREPSEMADAARWARDQGVSVVDINLGCPAKKIVQRGAGAALLCEPERALRLAERVVRAVEIPVTAKMRLGWDEQSIIAPTLAGQLEEAGIAAVTIHGRTAVQKFSGTIDIEGIAHVVQAVRGIPVIGNGDIRRPADAKAMIERTGCAGVMIGRAALRDPWIFRDIHAYLTTGRTPPPPRPAERITLINRHFENLLHYYGQRRAILMFRQRVSWYFQHLAAPRAFRDQIRLLRSPEEYRELVATYLADTEKATE